MSIKDSVHALLKDTIERLGLFTWFDITDKSIKAKNGSEFLFRGMKDTNAQSVKSIEGIDICWIEEGQTFSKSSLKIIGPTIRKYESEIWITFNPKLLNDAVYKEFVVNPPPKAIVCKVNFDQNPYFPEVLEEERQESLRKIYEALNDSEREQAQSDYDNIWLGDIEKKSREVILAGKIVEMEFDEKNLIRNDHRILYGADFGFSQDPSTLVRMFIKKDTNELYITHEAYGIGVELEEMKEFYLSVPGAKDWPIRADCARPETISYLRGKGFNISAADKWQGSVEDGITHLRGFKRIIVHPRCKHFLEESKNYKYKVDKQTGEVLPIIIDKWNHMIDACRYGLSDYIQRRGTLGTWERLGQNG